MGPALGVCGDAQNETAENFQVSTIYPLSLEREGLFWSGSLCPARHLMLAVEFTLFRRAVSGYGQGCIR